MFSVTKGEGGGEGGGVFSVRKRKKQFCACAFVCCIWYAVTAFSVGLARENFDSVVEFVVSLR